MSWFRKPIQEDVMARAGEMCRRRLDAAARGYAATSEAHHLLAQILAQADARAASPTTWLDAFAHALLAILADLWQRRQEAEQERASLQSEVTYLRRQVDAYWRHPLQQQVREVERERDACREEAERLRRRLAQVEAALARERAWWEQERTRLEQTIADLNRIVAEQQEALMALTEEDAE